MNTNVSVSLSAVAQAHTEAVSLFTGGRWTSPVGGWFPSTAGSWLQTAEGVRLTTEAGAPCGRLQGMVATLVNTGDTGRFQIEATGDSGHWTVVATTP